MPSMKARSAVTKTELEQAIDLLCAKDKRLAKLITEVGPCQLKVDQIQSPFAALAEAIVYQQLTGKAAATIYGRVRAMFGAPQLLLPEHILSCTEESLRAAGCSRAKAAALIDLAVKTKQGLLPELEEMALLSDLELVERLTTVRGIGRWTVEMLLIFRLGRLDVLPNTDYGIRKGFALTFGSGGSASKVLQDLPSPLQIAERAERWRPYRTVASWYLWRANDLERLRGGRA